VSVADAIRRQLLLDEQRELFDAWTRLAGADRLPCRRDLEPQAFMRLLPRIALLDVEPDGAFRFRLAGTGLRQIYGRDPTGARLDDVAAPQTRDYWRRAHGLVVSEARPRCGAARSPIGADSGVVLWLRLPLSEDGRRVTSILAYDHPLSAGEASTFLRRSTAA
jgi:hypothetical protein